MKRKVCKYCELTNHEAAKCRNKNNPSKHKCVLCRKHSLQCDVIRKAREKLVIKLTRKEDAFLKKNASQPIPIKSNVQRQPKNYSYTDAAKESAFHQLQSLLQSVNPTLMGIGNRSRDGPACILNNINEFYSKAQILEQNLHQKQPHICLLQEGFRSKKKDIDYNFQYLYVHHWSGQEDLECY
ncbi:hypothetical protein RFI_39189, partial [Reticulomyxa filosa]